MKKRVHDSLESVYRDVYFRTREREMAWRSPYICNALFSVYHPKNIIDVGCGVGDLVSHFLFLGIDAYGVEGAKTAVKYMMFPSRRLIMHDLRKKWEGSRKFDLVISFDVAEHIEEEFSDEYINTLISVAKDDIVFSAAPPGQGGIGHVNLQEMEYWIDKFMRHEFLLSVPRIDFIRSLWESVRDKKEIRSHYENLIVFRREPPCSQENG